MVVLFNTLSYAYTILKRTYGSNRTPPYIVLYIMLNGSHPVAKPIIKTSIRRPHLGCSPSTPTTLQKKPLKP